MELLEKIGNDIKEAMKAQEKERLSALRCLKSSLLENKTSAKPKPELDVVVAYCKKIKDSIETFQKIHLAFVILNARDRE